MNSDDHKADDAKKIKHKPYSPMCRVFRPCLDDNRAVGSNAHNTDEMNRAAHIANRAIARMMQC